MSDIENCYNNETIHKLFEKIAEKYPNQEALIDGEKSISYCELNKRSNMLANFLVEHNVKLEIPVGIYLDRSINFIISILAVLKAGGYYVPLDPDYPIERIKYIVNDIDSPLILSEEKYINSLSDFGCKSIAIDNEIVFDKYSDDNLKSISKSNNLAYILYTSGSTGKPKGVKIEHKNLVNLVLWHHSIFKEIPPYKVGQAARIGFDASVWEIWSHLTAGGCLCFVPKDLILAPNDLANWIVDHKIEEIFLPTPVAELMLDVNWPEGCRLKYLHSGGDRLRKKPGKKFPAALTNLYGPTECTVIATTQIAYPGDDDGQVPTIGTPISNCSIYILNDKKEKVGAGEIGEIYIAGDVVGRGYHNLPEQTENSFIKNPFNNSNEIIYKTGDLGKYLPNGEIDFIGRVDFQVKIRGLRIELGEIEAVISKHKNVDQAVVATVEQSTGNKFLVAYVTLNKSLANISNQIKELAANSLPDYMIPTNIIVLDKMPLTVNGKIDRKSLPSPKLDENQQIKFIAPRNKTEQQIEKIWCNILKLNKIGIDSDFFEIGGNSLLMTIVNSEIERIFNKRVSVRDFFNSPTIRELALIIDKTGNVIINESFYVLKQHDESRNIFPASMGQQSMWLTEKTSASMNIYNIPVIVHLNGKLNITTFIKSIKYVIQNHEILRTSFRNSNNELEQVITHSLGIEIPLIDFSSLSQNEQEARLKEILRQAGNTEFNLSEAPLFIIKLIKFNEDLHHLLFTIHHTIFDGWSATVFFREIGEYYKSQITEKEYKNQVQLQYGDYALWQKDFLDSDNCKKQLDYWKNKLSNVRKTISLPVDNEYSLSTSSSGARCYFDIPETLTQKLNQFSKDKKVSLFMYLTAVLHTLLKQYSSQNDIITGTAIANRNHPSVEKIIGPFINALPICTNLNDDMTFDEVLRQVKQSTLEAYENQDIPFNYLIQKLDIQPDAERSPIFQVSLILQNYIWPDSDYAGIKMSYDEFGNSTSKLDLLFVFEERNGKLHSWIEYNNKIFNKDTIEKMVADYSKLCHKTLENPNKNISDYSQDSAITKNLSCFIIGETSLPVYCAEILIENSITIKGLISPDEDNKIWAEKNNIPYYHPGKTDILKVLQKEPFDYLFSIINSYILKREVLELPREYPINYHDSLLPAYAGVNSTSWAILNREKAHGVTWHIMEETIDTGGIFKQITIPILPSETSLSLNTKCYEAAGKTFEELIKELKAKTYKLTTPDLKNYSYFPLNKKPENMGIINWNSDALSIEAFVRAMEFGEKYPNPIATPKIIVGNKLLIVKKAEVLQTKSDTDPGTIISVTEGSIVISTATNDLKVFEIIDVNSKNINCSGCFSVDDNVSTANTDIKELSQVYNKVSQYEDFWLKRLINYFPLELTFYNNAFIQNAVPDSSVELPVYNSLSDDNILFTLSLFSSFLSRLTEENIFDIGLKTSLPEKYSNIFAEYVPFRIKVNSSYTIAEHVKATKKILSNRKKYFTFCNDLILRNPELGSCSPSYPICIDIADEKVFLTYDSKVVDNDNISGLINNFAFYIETAAKNPGLKLSEIPIVNQSELNLQLIEWNNTETDFSDITDIFPLDFTFQEVFEKNIKTFENSTAVSFKEHSFTYKELNIKANQLAEYLRKNGIKSNVPVGICMERSLFCIIGLLAIIKAGGAYMPVDPGYPTDRIKFMLEDSNASIVLTDNNSKDKLPESEAEILNIESNWDILCSGNDGVKNLQVINKPDDIFYIIYTSGSTGTPKGVLITHRNILNHNYSVIKDYNITSKDRVLQFGSISFDLSAEEIFPCLLAGGELILRTDEVLSSVNKFIEFVNFNKISVLDLPTAFWHEFVDGLQDNNMPPSIRLVIIGGEKASAEKLKRWRKNAAGKVRLINTYGPTETTIIASMCELTEDMPAGEFPIGNPVANTKLYILDKNLKPLPIGIPGELHIGGEAVGRGYLNRPDLTAEKFIIDPFSKEGRGRLYKTGDLVKYRNDGNIDFLGRIDTQVKIRGFRIELGEVESTILKIPGIKDCTVDIREETPGNKVMIAYYVSDASDIKTSEEIRDLMKTEVPEYMLPALFVKLDKIPLTPNGKVDKRSLPEPEMDNIFSSSDYVPPTTEEEIKLSEIFKEVLKLQKVSIKDSFFALGGHSLSAMQVVSRVQNIFGVECHVKTIFSHPTISELAKFINQSKKDKVSFNNIIKKRSEADIVPLSFSEQRLWFINKYDESDNGTYNVPVAVQIKGQLNITRIKECFNILIKRHEALRTSFPGINGSPAVSICSPYDIEINLTKSDQTKIRSQLIEESKYKFNLAELPLFKVDIFEIEDDTYVMLMNFHHIICDGWSLKIFINEFNTIYNALLENKDYQLPELEIQYSDFAVWQAQQPSKEYFKKQMSYWIKELTGYSDLELPTDFKRPTNQTYNGDIFRFDINKETTAKIKSYSADTGFSSFMIVLTVFNILLKRYSGSDDIILGTPIANRNRKEIENIIGVFINSVILRNNLGGDPKFSELLENVSNRTMEAFDNQDIPIEHLVKSIIKKRETSRHPFFQIMIIMQNASNDAHLKFSDAEVEEYKTDYKNSKFEITLILEEVNDIIECCFEYNTDLYAETTIKSMSEHFSMLLNSALNNTEVTINKLQMLPPKELETLLTTWNNTEVPLPDKCMHCLISEKSAEFSDKKAVICGNQSITYSELNKKSDILARYLVEKGISPKDFVGIYMNRSIDMIISLLAVWKAGAAYIPLDPSFPTQRLIYMLEDSKPGLVITETEFADSDILKESKCINIDNKEWEERVNINESPLNINYNRNFPAYMIYTSGSTGNPKGVVISQGNVVNFIQSMQKMPGISKDDILLAVTTLSFDIAVLELYLPLATGAQIILVESNEILDSYKLIQLIDNYNVTFMQATPSTWKMLLDAKWKGSSNFKALSGGEPITPQLAEELLEKCTELWNMYGPTETTVWSTLHKIESSKSPIYIGRPIDNTTIYILDGFKNPVPVGIPGNLFIGGKGLALGYHNRAELTSEKFIRSPFDSSSHELIYDTGDIAKYNKEGLIECLGRDDFQVKIRGHRIELGEIAAKIQDINDINDAVVNVYIDKDQRKTLVGYVITDNDKEISEQTIKDSLKSILPDYMVPAVYMKLNSFPLTPNGKIDRKKLPAPQSIETASDKNYVAPSNPIEEILCNCYSKVLNINNVGINDNFFELGGDSLLTIQVIENLHKASLKVKVEQLFKNHTIKELAKDILNNTESNYDGADSLSCLVELQKGKEGAIPFFLMHTPPGDLLGYVNLVMELDNDIPVYGLRSIGLDNPDLCHKTIPEMASYYIEKILEVQPEGPYMIGGWCLGGTIAFEVALQLQQRGKKIDLLALFDAIGQTPKNTNRKLIYNLDRLSGFILSGPKKWFSYISAKTKSIANDEMDEIINNDNTIKDIGIFSNRSVVRANNMNAAMAYKTEFFNGKITVFKAKEQHPSIMPHPQLCWTKLARKVNMIVVPGEHGSVLKPPNVQVLAECLNRIIVDKKS